MPTRVAVVTQDDPFYMPLFFESFFSALSEDVEVFRVYILQSFDESLPELASRMYRLYGPVNFARQGIRYAYRTAMNALGAKYSVEAVAVNASISVSHIDSVNTEEFVGEIKDRDVDVLLSVSAPEIFDADLLQAPSWGCLNVHTAELPKYRGMLPTFWALYHGENEIGVTVHTMEEEIDQGQIVRQTTFSVDNESLDDVIQRGKRTGGRLAAAALDDVSCNEVTLSPMEGEGSYFSFPTIEERREFQRRGGRLL
ncbi:formyltransferase family protein [Halorussus marinus]|uniref:formyltransferase family protein n=1 Tax=Halorussus marinus TaxID=2505976 RepID=UPI00106E4D35|nr:formyltransferase family protein [Halorussus marinus]